MLFLVSEAKVDVCGAYVGGARVRSGEWEPRFERVVISNESIYLQIENWALAR